MSTTDPSPPSGGNNINPPPQLPPRQGRQGSGLPGGIPLPSIRLGIPGSATLRIGGHAQNQLNNNNVPPPPPPTNNINNNNNAGEMPTITQTQNLFQMRDRLFLALFFRISLMYARAFPRTFRRVLEFCFLMQSIILLFILAYIHVAYTRTPITCLGPYRDNWPKNGVLRVEIGREGVGESPYDLAKSYAKEERMRQRQSASQLYSQYADDILSLMFTADTVLLDRVVSTAGGLLATITGDSESPSTSTSTSDQVSPTSSIDTEPPPPQPTPDESSTTTSSSSSSVFEGTSDSETETASIMNDSFNTSEEQDDNLVAAGEGEDTKSGIIDNNNIAPSIPVGGSGEGSSSSSMFDYENVNVNDPDSPFFNKTLEEIETIKMKQRQMEEEKVLNSSVTDFEMFANSVWTQEQAYIVEYALEYGFLRLSPETRQKLGIPVKLVILDPTKETCFGDHFSLFLLDNFLGYDDILMSSIKNLAESEESKGYLRNVVTGEHFRFFQMWTARTSYIPAMLIMIVFTVSISMLLRYSHHQIFVFIVDLLNNMEGAGSIHIPAAPLFTVILALVGMEAIMSEFFNDTSTAFYVILIVWIADQYDSVCSHTAITKTFWVRFFYLYHFAFYAYHYRFNGQYGGLALLVSWSFIQHSMVYFYHHYELPAILRQAQGQQQENEDTARAARNGDVQQAPSSPQEGGEVPPQQPDPSTNSNTTTTSHNNEEVGSESNPTPVSSEVSSPSLSPEETNTSNHPASTSSGDRSRSIRGGGDSGDSIPSSSSSSAGLNSNECNPIRSKPTTATTPLSSVLPPTQVTTSSSNSNSFSSSNSQGGESSGGGGDIDIPATGEGRLPPSS